MKKWLFAALILSLAGCATNATMLGVSSTNRLPVPWKEVAIYRTAEQVPGKYEEIALLNSSTSSWDTEKAMFQSMQRKAGKVGANAIIIDSVIEPSAGAKVAAFLFLFSGAERKGKAVAIYVHPNQTKGNKKIQKTK